MSTHTFELDGICLNIKVVLVYGACICAALCYNVEAVEAPAL